MAEIKTRMLCHTQETPRRIRKTREGTEKLVGNSATLQYPHQLWSEGVGAKTASHVFLCTQSLWSSVSRQQSSGNVYGSQGCRNPIHSAIKPQTLLRVACRPVWFLQPKSAVESASLYGLCQEGHTHSKQSFPETSILLPLHGTHSHSGTRTLAFEDLPGQALTVSGDMSSLRPKHQDCENHAWEGQQVIEPGFVALLFCSVALAEKQDAMWE